MHHQRHFDRVRGLVSGYAGVPEAEITLETRLFEDLGIDGDDGDELLEAFADEFGIDLRAVSAANYFNSESVFGERSMTIPLVAWFAPRFRAYVQRATRGLCSLRVRDLVVSAQAKRWVRPGLPRSDADLTRLGWWGWLVLTLSLLFPLFLGLRAYLLWDTSAVRAASIGLWTLLLFWALLAIKFTLALRWLQHLDRAAAWEEQHLSAAD